jgi:hypothetical protein
VVVEDPAMVDVVAASEPGGALPAERRKKPIAAMTGTPTVAQTKAWTNAGRARNLPQREA